MEKKYYYEIRTEDREYDGDTYNVTGSSCLEVVNDKTVAVEKAKEYAKTHSAVVVEIWGVCGNEDLFIDTIIIS